MRDIREAQVEAMAHALIEVGGYTGAGIDDRLALTESFHPITFREVAVRLLTAAIEARV